MKTLAILAASALVCSSTARASVPEVSSEVYEQIVAYALANLVETTEPMALYHWNTRDSFGEGTPEAAAEFEKHGTEAPLKFRKASGPTLGEGLYFSTDPITTRSFGGKDWGVLESILAPRQRLLDLRRSNHRIQFARSLYETLERKYECMAGSLQDLFQQGQFENCHKLKVRLMKDPRIGAVGAVYRYGSISYFDCLAPNGRGKDPTTIVGNAFFIWDAKAIQSRTLVTSLTPLDSPDVGRIQAIYEARKARWDNLTPGPDTYPAASATARPSPEGLLEWMKAFLWACRPNL